MSKTIKIIDLLNKIANGEKVPKNIYHNGIEYEFKGTTYYDNCGDLMCSNMDILTCLNDEVEIIEKQQEIDIQDIRELLELEEYEVDKTDVKVNRQVIKQLVQAVKQLDKKMKEK